MRLLFDQETGLLARVHDELPTALGPVAQETDFEEYRRVDGALVPHLIRWARPDYLVTFRVRDVVQTAGDR